jgi:hypothetical protein
MPLYNTNLPQSTRAPKRREFRGSGWDNTLLALTGANKDGTSNVFGDVVSNALPVVLGLISSYYTGNYQLGDKVGQFAVKGLDSGSNKILAGTDAQVVNKQQSTKDDKTRALISTIGNTAAGLYTSFGGQTYSSKNGNSATASTPQIPSTSQGRTNPTLDPNSALAKFYGSDQSNFDLGSLINNYNSAPSSPGQSLSLGKNSSVVGTFGDALWLDEKKGGMNFGSSLPYDAFSQNQNGFWKGGKTLHGKPKDKMKKSYSHRFTDPLIKKKTQ